MRLSDLFEAWSRSTAPSEPTRYRYERAFEMLTASGFKSTRSLTRPRFASYQEERRAAGVKAATLNLELVAVCAALRWLERQGRFPRVRLEELRSLRLREGRPAPPDFYSPAEFLTCRLAARELAPWFGLAFEMACYTGVRRSELIRLEREDFDLGAKVLRVRRKLELGARGETKSRRERVLSLCPDAIRLVREVAPPLGPLFPSRNGSTRFMRHECFSNRMLELSAETGIHATWHKCRRTFTTTALRAGVPPTDVAAMLGHAGSGLALMFNRYRAEIPCYSPAIERLSFRVSAPVTRSVSP